MSSNQRDLHNDTHLTANSNYSYEEIATSLPSTHIGSFCLKSAKRDWNARRSLSFTWRVVGDYSNENCPKIMRRTTPFRNSCDPTTRSSHFKHLTAINKIYFPHIARVVWSFFTCHSLFVYSRQSAEAWYNIACARIFCYVQLCQVSRSRQF